MDCSKSCSRAVMATWRNRGSAAGKISRSRLAPSSALGPSIIKALAQKTGMSEQELTAQLSQALPGFVDKLTPQGRLPTHEELARFGDS